ncbi:hypothetical protein BCON_0019g00440 [Botryotinia convoluta]|uniref:DUF7587 domain-containing protein n=1 Tax=Botryotinia convoluta TaxID=54673 RepID=A0A4Z1IM21_9HELO|nr:hypothetical protein BCON_0019g00440 [Botryotinia convoluta]
MASQLFYRVYSPKSAGGLVCGKATEGSRRPSHINPEREFETHKVLSNREPTALVSVTSSITRALKTAFNKEYEDKEDPAGIWIAIIKVPDRDTDVYHSAQEMAKRCREQNSVLFKDEYLFEWEIPMEYVVHRVSVKTLSKRGLNMKENLLLDWWLLSDKFNYDYECHLEYAFHLQEIMTSQWNEFSRYVIDISEDPTRYEEELEILRKREEDMEAEIEADAVRTGL